MQALAVTGTEGRCSWELLGRSRVDEQTYAAAIAGVGVVAPGQYGWHCHIVVHEDNEMIRPYRAGPEQPGQPG